MVRRGVSLVEVSLASVLVALLALPFLQMLSTGAESTARAGENQVAALIAARVMDRVAGVGYAALVRGAGKEHPANLSRTGEPQDSADRTRGTALVDGVGYAGVYRIEAPREGLVRVTLIITWHKAGTAGAHQAGSLEVSRLVADPAAGSDMHPTFAEEAR